MFNVTIINIKDSIKYITTLIITLLLIFFFSKFFSKVGKDDFFNINLSEKLIECLDIEIPVIAKTYYKSQNILKEDTEEVATESITQKILGIELAQIQETNKEETKNNQTEENNAQIAENNESNVSTEVATGVETEIVTQNPISESYNVEINGVKIKNETSFQIDNTILENTLEMNKENVIIFHTHTCESYTPSEQYQYQQTGNFRTTDLNYTVSRVGDELTNYLLGFGFNVNHDKTYHDYPAYTGSYTRSLESVTNDLKTFSSDIIIDLHRDAIGSKSNYDPSVKIGKDVAAQLMFVIGTNGGGLYHPNWKSNLQFAIELQQKANEMYPGLFKPVIVRNSRYNQHLGKAACIIEVGATGNTLEQCLNSMKYLSKVLDEYLK